jgi:hypothetical protein
MIQLCRKGFLIRIDQFEYPHRILSCVTHRYKNIWEQRCENVSYSSPITDLQIRKSSRRPRLLKVPKEEGIYSLDKVLRYIHIYVASPLINLTDLD